MIRYVRFCRLLVFLALVSFWVMMWKIGVFWEIIVGEIVLIAMIWMYSETIKALEDHEERARKYED